jgi:hypothetical protein
MDDCQYIGHTPRLNHGDEYGIVVMYPCLGTGQQVDDCISLLVQGRTAAQYAIVVFNLIAGFPGANGMQWCIGEGIYVCSGGMLSASHIADRRSSRSKGESSW